MLTAQAATRKATAGYYGAPLVVLSRIKQREDLCLQEVAVGQRAQARNLAYPWLDSGLHGSHSNISAEGH
jgi:hypothetical protein